MEGTTLSPSYCVVNLKSTCVVSVCLGLLVFLTVLQAECLNGFADLYPSFIVVEEKL